MVAALETLGKGATIAEIVGATTKLELLLVAGGLYGSTTLVQSLVVGRSISCGGRLADLSMLMAQHPNLSFPDWNRFYADSPEIMNSAVKLRKQRYIAKSTGVVAA